MPKEKKRKGAPPRLESGKDVNKYIGNKINERIDKGAGKLEGSGKKLIGSAGKYITEKGGDKHLTDYFVRQGSKAAGRLIRKGAGAAKHFIHTEGRNIVNQGIHKVKEGVQHLGKRAREGFENFTQKFKRQKR